MTHLTCTVEHRVAVITLDNSPQNRIGDQMVDALAAAMKRVASSDARAVLLCAGGPGFSFGGGLELAVRADVLFASSTARFAHPEQTLGIVTLLGGIYRVAERAGRARASEWALSSEQVSATFMERAGVVNKVFTDADLLVESRAFVDKLAKGPTRAYTAHKVLLRAWANGGVAAADEIMFDVAMPVFDSRDATDGIASAVDAIKAARPRPAFPFEGA
jgi:enoyl-CoA hydratase/carnithine racemase